MNSISRSQGAPAIVVKQVGIKSWLVALLVASLCCAGQIRAEESDDTKLTSGPAIAANGRYRLLIDQAKTQMVIDLKVALKESMQTGKLEEANRINRIIDSSGDNADEPLESPKGRSALTRYKATERRAALEYVLALKGALAQSLKAAQLDESNRIAAEIKKVEELTGRTADSSGGFINLLPRIDPSKDAIKGTWTVEKGALMCSGIGEERIEIPYKPPSEYDYRITFTKTGTNCVLQILSENGAPFIWLMDVNGWFMFRYLKGTGTGHNKTSVQKPPGIKDSHRYTSLVRVRKNGAEGLLDGVVMTKWKTDYSDAASEPYWALRDSHLLGVGASESKTVFHTIEVKEVTGHGKFQR